MTARVRKEWLAAVSWKITAWYSGWMPGFMGWPIKKRGDYTYKSTPSHGLEEFGVLLGGLDLVDEEFGRFELVHRVEQLAQHPDLLQQLLRDQQFLAPGAGAVDVDGRENALFVHAPVEVDLQVAGALEFLVDHIVHAAAGVDQRGGDDGERAAFLDVARRAEEALGLLQRVRVHAARQHLARGRLHGVVGAREARDGIEQDHHGLLVLDQALGLLDDHFGDLHVARGRLVESRGDHFAAHAARHLGHFLGPLVDEQDNERHFGVVGDDGMRDVLQHDGLARLGRRDDEDPLPFADRRDDVDDAAGDVFLGLDLALQLESLVRMQRREVLEQDLVLGRLGRLAVDLVHLDQREVALAVPGRADLALDRVN